MSPNINVKEIQDAIRKRYAEVSRSAEGKFAYPIGKAVAETLGYDSLDIVNAPKELLDSFCGVGNPFSLGQISPGEAVLDIGCGAGFDILVSSRLVGLTGRVCGIDFTPEMVACAQSNLRRAGVSNVEVRLASSEVIPYDDSTFDVVISNGVLNLSPYKEKSFQEIFRVLRTDGRFQFADIVLNEDLPPEVADSADAWSQ